MFVLGKAKSAAVFSGSILASASDEAKPLMTLSDKVLELFEQLRTPVFRYLMRRTHNVNEAEDLTQEAFLRLCRHLQEDRPLENPKAWLFTVANNLAIDKTRSEGNLQDLDESSWKEIEESRSALHENPESLLLQAERLDRLHLAVLRLTPLQRQCLHLRAEGLRYREIAELLEISMSTVVDAVRRATINLARDCGPELDGEVSA